jgi:hypothetical protein
MLRKLLIEADFKIQIAGQAHDMNIFRDSDRAGMNALITISHSYTLGWRLYHLNYDVHTNTSSSTTLLRTKLPVKVVNMVKALALIIPPNHSLWRGAYYGR